MTDPPRSSQYTEKHFSICMRRERSDSASPVPAQRRNKGAKQSQLTSLFGVAGASGDRVSVEEADAEASAQHVAVQQAMPQPRGSSPQMHEEGLDIDPMALDAGDLDGSIRSDAYEASLKSKSWFVKCFEKVPYDAQLLSDRGRQVMQGKPQPEFMLKCAIPHLYDGDAQIHTGYFVMNSSRTLTSNNVQHVKDSHKALCSYMEKALKENQSVDVAFLNGLKTVASELEARSNRSRKITSFMPVGKGPSAVALSQPLRENLSLVVFLADADIAPNAVERKSFGDFKTAINKSFEGRKKLSMYQGLLSQVARDMIQQDFERAGFICVQFDFATINNDSVLIALGDSCTPSFELISHLIGAVPFYGKKSAPLVDFRIKSILSRAVPNDNVLVCGAGTDGALLAAAKELVPENEVSWCGNHQVVLIVNDAVEKSQANVDFCFFSAVGSFLVNHSIALDELEVAYVDRAGSSKGFVKPLRAQITRWEWKYRVVKRLLRLKEPLTAVYQNENSALHVWVQGLISGTERPSDAFSRIFWLRLEEYSDLLLVFHLQSKHLESDKACTIGDLFLVKHRLSLACALVEGESPVVATLKKALLAGLEARFGFLASEVSPALMCAIIDPYLASKLKSFGVSSDLLDRAWDRFKVEHIENLLEKRRRKVQNPEAGLLDGQEAVAQGQVQMVRASIQEDSVALLSDKARRGTVLSYWKSKMEPVDENAPFIAVAGTARMIFARKASTAGSERKVLALRRSFTVSRNRMNADTMEDELILSHFVKLPTYSFDALVGKVNEKLTAEASTADAPTQSNSNNI